MAYFRSPHISLMTVMMFLVLVLGMAADHCSKSENGSSHGTLKPGGITDCCATSKENRANTGELDHPEKDFGSPVSEADGCHSGFCSTCCSTLFLVSDSRFCHSLDEFLSQVAFQYQLPSRIFTTSLFRPPKS